MTFYSHKIASLVCLFHLVGGSSSWAADPTVAAKVISQAGAQQLLSAAEHEAEALHAPPLNAGAQVVGAVGIASLDKDNDVKIAQAAAAAFASLSPGHPAAQ